MELGRLPAVRDGLAALGMRYVLDVPGGTTVSPFEPTWTSNLNQSRISGARAPPRTQAAGMGSVGPWSSVVMSCRMTLGGR